MNFKYNTKQRNKTIQGLRSFKDTLPQEAKRILNKKGQIYSETLDNWKYIVGNELFKVCYPRSFKNSKLNGSCLNIMVKRGNEVDLEYSKKNITLIDNTPEEIKEACIEMVERLNGNWISNDDEENLQKKFWSIYQSEKKYNGWVYHGKIKARIGTSFIRTNLNLLL